MKIISRNFVVIFSLLFLFFVGCKHEKVLRTITVCNVLEFDRNEVVSIPCSNLNLNLNDLNKDNLLLRENSKKDYNVLQWVDNNLDGEYDELLFMADVDAKSTKEYELLWKKNGEELQPKPKVTTYSRFVPERIDDYAWENDKVAFRAYGPKAQQLVEEGREGGTLSSGIDLWLKRVDYSIIDHWYNENAKQPGYYHIDHGEGYDPYHVGASRGTGGIGVWGEDSLYTSKNFIAYRTITTGPLRTIFELDYAPWSKYNIKETKRISLDLGSNFSRVEEILFSETIVPDYAIGITLHDNKGETKLDIKNGVYRHWEPIDDSYVGEGVIIKSNQVTNAEVYKTDIPDQSHLLISTKPCLNLIYYIGFAWQKSDQVHNIEDWDSILLKQSKFYANPLFVICN
ncbi:DUF4861 family protein [Plebeiibacterium sediminum]|uniref:DUF4861 domain-containing protein n=1 Tax=Plebeiibacterium sediminum TaxID=2992112 RepID=A0AAE3SFV3_9BACT|nr:DUF4861 family protein [Plebeiobacterium sediminum]MCW3787666.1 DUF4861 domain-containing protein [Plebeiobacterium sediminum]